MSAYSGLDGTRILAAGYSGLAGTAAANWAIPFSGTRASTRLIRELGERSASNPEPSE